MRDTRQSYSTQEKDRRLKTELYNKLKEVDFKTESEHVKLKFKEKFIINDDGESRTVTLCEKCYVQFNEHICKLSYNIFRFNHLLITLLNV